MSHRTSEMDTAIQYHQSGEPVLTLTDAAVHRILTYLSTQVGKMGLRLSVEKTGCSGLSYVIDYVEKIEDNDPCVYLNQDCFVSIQKSSYPYLKGVHIDYVQQGLNRKFVFTNPNQTGACGCGESFTV